MLSLAGIELGQDETSGEIPWPSVAAASCAQLWQSLPCPRPRRVSNQLTVYYERQHAAVALLPSGPVDNGLVRRQHGRLPPPGELLFAKVTTPMTPRIVLLWSLVL